MKSVGVAVALLLFTAAADARRILRPPPPPPPLPNVGAELAAAIRKKDATAVAALLGTAVENHGVWFSDAACAKQFAKPAILRDAARTAFARCLARAKLQATTRKPSGGSHAILTLEPGIELELGAHGGRVQWIGYEAQTHGDAGRPTLTLQAFEALRKSGSPIVDDAVRDELEPLLDGAQRTSVLQWMKICLDEKGAIDRAAAVASSDSYPRNVGDAFAAAMRAWSFRPFAPGGKATPACALMLMTYPASRAPLVEQLPPPVKPRLAGASLADLDGEAPIYGTLLETLPPVIIPRQRLEQLRISGSPPIPADPQTLRAMAARGQSRLTGSVRLCVDDTGRVTTVSTLRSTGFPDYDAKVIAAMKRWRYRPYVVNGAATPVCVLDLVMYSTQPAAATP